MIAEPVTSRTGQPVLLVNLTVQSHRAGYPWLTHGLKLDVRIECFLRLRKKRFPVSSLWSDTKFCNQTPDNIGERNVTGSNMQRIKCNLLLRDSIDPRVERCRNMNVGFVRATVCLPRLPVIHKQFRVAPVKQPEFVHEKSDRSLCMNIRRCIMYPFKPACYVQKQSARATILGSEGYRLLQIDTGQRICSNPVGRNLKSLVCHTT